MYELLFFRHYFNLLALAGGLAEWLVACWVLAAYGTFPPPLAHLVAPAVLAVMNRLAARRLEHESPRGVLSGQTGHVVLAVALAAIVGVGAIGGAAALCVGLQFMGGRAEAGVLATHTAGALLSLEFRVLGSLALGLSTSAVAYGYVRGFRNLVVTDVDVPVPGLPPALAGFRIAHVSDLHVGPIAHREALREALAHVMALDADLICITGDIVDDPSADLAKWIPELDVLSARHGVVTILGNHDQRVGFARVAAALHRWSACRVLRNEHIAVDVAGVRLHLVGLDHQPASAAGPVLDRALAAVPTGEPVVLLVHHPNLFPVAAARGVALTLSGHTHGGQLAVPGIPRLNVARLLIGRYDLGTFVEGRSILHVNRGLGTSGQPVRVGAPREISILRLVPAETPAT